MHLFLCFLFRGCVGWSRGGLCDVDSQKSKPAPSLLDWWRQVWWSWAADWVCTTLQGCQFPPDTNSYCRCFLYLLACFTRVPVWVCSRCEQQGVEHTALRGSAVQHLNRGGVAANLNCLGFCTQAQSIQMAGWLHGWSYSQCCAEINTQPSEAGIDIF